MYNPSDFKVQDKSLIVQFIRNNGFGVMFSATGGEMAASSVPTIVDNSCTIVKGHLAKANNMWRGLDGSKVLVVFSGPNHYISPVWYGEDDVVPTWNYVSVQLTGTFRIVDDSNKAMAILDELVEFYEAKMGQDWKVDWAIPKYSKMVNAIVAFMIEVDRVEGKWKLSQNHPRKNTSMVAKNLREIDSCNARSIAELMEQL